MSFMSTQADMAQPFSLKCLFTDALPQVPKPAKTALLVGDSIIINRRVKPDIVEGRVGDIYYNKY